MMKKERPKIAIPGGVTVQIDWLDRVRRLTCLPSPDGRHLIAPGVFARRSRPVYILAEPGVARSEIVVLYNALRANGYRLVKLVYADPDSGPAADGSVSAASD
jgi:hypothetical protein